MINKNPILRSVWLLSPLSFLTFKIRSTCDVCSLAVGGKSQSGLGQRDCIEYKYHIIYYLLILRTFTSVV